MPKMTTCLALVGLIFALVVGAVAPAMAGYFACDSAHQRNAVSACARSESASPFIREFAARKRPRVTIYRRRVYPGPNAVRQCRSWLVTEYRVSGPVIVPQMRCWWE